MLLIALLGLMPATPSFADTSVKLMSASTDQADLMVNGWVLRRMRAGQTSPEGVRLISAAKDSAEVEVNGKRCTLRLGQAAGSSVTLQADSQGHFFTTIQINGFSTRAMVDTGATFVAINMTEAQRMGINYTQGERMELNTANGKAPGWCVTFDSVKMGEIELRNVRGVVHEGGPEKLSKTLLGMSFLSQLDTQNNGTTLVLTKR